MMIGGCRNQEDEDREKELKKIVEDIDLSNSVMFIVNVGLKFPVDF